MSYRKTIMFLLIGLFLFVTVAVQAADYQAKYCEIFVDRIVALRSTHDSGAYIQLFLKVKPERLDSPIAEVFAHQQVVSISRSGRSSTLWRNIPLTQLSLSQDQWATDNYCVLNDYGRDIYHTVFAVRTQKGTTYWMNPNHDILNTYTINTDLFSYLAELSGQNPFLHGEFSTQENTSLRAFNPEVCY